MNMGGCLSSPRPISADRIDQPARTDLGRGPARFISACDSHGPDHASGTTATSKSDSLILPANLSDFGLKTGDHWKSSMLCATATEKDSGHSADCAHGTLNSDVFQPARSTRNPPPPTQHHVVATMSPLTPSSPDSDWSRERPPRRASSTSAGDSTVLTSAFQGMDDIDTQDNPIEHILPPELPQTAFGRRLARRSEWNNNIMGPQASVQTQVPNQFVRVRSAESSAGSYATSKAVSYKG